MSSGHYPRPERSGSHRRPDKGEGESYTKRLFRTLLNSRLRMASRRTLKLQERVEELENEVGELSLLSLSLMTVLFENKLLDEEQLDQIMEQLDAEDGVIDGRARLRDLVRYLPQRYQRRRESGSIEVDAEDEGGEAPIEDLDEDDGSFR